MAYTPNTWQSIQGQGLNRFQDQDGNIYYLTAIPEQVTQPGTPFSADWMNHIEQGIADIDNSLAEPNGIATLDSSGKLVQMPTATDVGITEMHQTITANERFKSVAVRVARIGNIVTITAPIINNYEKGEGGYPVMLTLPADYRPSTAVDILLPTTGSGDMANVLVNNTSGNVEVGLLGNSATVNLRINFSYVI